MTKPSNAFPDHNQNFWQLACIQGAAQSLPIILIGGVLVKEYGPATAISSICIGNLILWLVGLAMVSMTTLRRKNTIENTKDYLGKGGSLLISLILMIAFLAWYMLELQSVTTAITPFLSSKTPNLLFGSTLGLTIALLATGGIRLIKWLAIIAFPFLLCYVCYGIITSSPIIFHDIWSFSFPAIIIVASLSLPGMVNLPTFFRHSKSQSDSFLALTLVTVFDILFQIYSVCTKMTEPGQMVSALNLLPNGTASTIISLSFLVISAICLNLVNTYYASAAIERISPRITGPKAFFFVGLMGTVSYILLQNSPTMLFLETVSSNCITNLGIVLTLSLIASIVVQHRPRVFEKKISTACWLLGCLITLMAQIAYPQSSTYSLLLGSSGIVLAFIAILFFEEMIWSIKSLFRTR